MPTTKRPGATATKSMATISSGKTSSVQRENGQSADKASAKTHKRSRSGCFTCRLRRKKCDEGHPICKACTNLRVNCEYKRPMWWGNPEQRRLHKEHIKNKIRQTKSLERSNTTQDNINRLHLNVASPTPLGPDYTFPFLEPHEPFGPHFATPGFVPISYGHYTPYEIDVTTEHQTFVNDVPLRQDSSVSTFSAIGLPQLHATLPTFPDNEWLEQDFVDISGAPPAVDPTICAQSVGQSHEFFEVSIPVDGYDKHLFDHFKANVLPMIFPILNLHPQREAHARSVLQSMGTNKSYYHCCLSVAAIHLKTTDGWKNSQIDHHIMRHRYYTIQELRDAYEAKGRGKIDHGGMLDTTLAMLLFHNSVGTPNEQLFDIPFDIKWSDHFLAASNLAKSVNLHEAVMHGNNASIVPFSMPLTSWIDILGSALLGWRPRFAETYRGKLKGGVFSGLKELMGCDDHVMYVISEIACLEDKKNQGRPQHELLEGITTAEELLNQIEPEDRTLESPYTTEMMIRPDVLTKNITTVFRLAARIYLRSLHPGEDRSSPQICNLVAAIAETLPFIPGGLGGFDRSLVWPLFIAGVFSTPSVPTQSSSDSTPSNLSPQKSHPDFRQDLRDRIDAIGPLGQLGNLGRMYQLLEKYWLRVDGSAGVPSPDPSYWPAKSKAELPPLLPVQAPGLPEIKPKQLHWRELMDKDYLKYPLI